MSTCYPLLLVLSALCVEIPSLCLESTLKRWNGQHENNTSSEWMNINCKDLSDHPNQNVNLSYLSIGLVFCWFGQFENSPLNLICMFPQAFKENASSSGGKPSVNDKEWSFTVTKLQTNKWKCNKTKGKFGYSQTFQTSREWDDNLKIMSDDITLESVKNHGLG